MVGRGRRRLGRQDKESLFLAWQAGGSARLAPRREVGPPQNYQLGHHPHNFFSQKFFLKNFMSKINIKNYTTIVPAATSAAQIEAILLKFGASHISKVYNAQQKLETIAFQLHTHGAHLPILMKPNVTGCFLWLKKHYGKGSKRTDAWFLEQAERLAWRHQFDILHMHLSSLEMQQAELLQLFLPDLADPATGASFYDTLKKNGFKGILPAAE